MSHNKKIIGFTPIYAPEKGQLVTQAFILCSNCRFPISTVMGPKSSALCFACTQEIMDAQNEKQKI